MKISILTLFPQMLQGPFSESIIKRAIGKKLIEINFIDIRNFGIGSHKTVDDTPYGGGIGMILRADVVKNAIDSAKIKGLDKTEERIILLSASGKTFDQKKARLYSRLKHLILVCGHYEGIDHRIVNFIDDEVSIGDYVLTGGEIPAMVIVDSVARLVKGVLKEEATGIESFSDKNLLEHIQYTKPQEFEGLRVPDTLLSGNHEKITEWRKKESINQTVKNRPDLKPTTGKD